MCQGTVLLQRQKCHPDATLLAEQLELQQGLGAWAACLAEDAQLLGVGLREGGGLLAAGRARAPGGRRAGQLLEVRGEALPHDGHQLAVDLAPVDPQVLQGAGSFQTETFQTQTLLRPVCAHSECSWGE